MPEAQLKLVLTVDAGLDADQEISGELALRLRHQLSDFNAARVEQVPSGALPSGAKGDIFSLTTLALTIAPAATTALINMLQSWLSRHERASITVESNGRKITITGHPTRQQEEMVATFLDAANPRTK